VSANASVLVPRELHYGNYAYVTGFAKCATVPFRERREMGGVDADQWGNSDFTLVIIEQNRYN